MIASPHNLFLHPTIRPARSFLHTLGPSSTTRAFWSPGLGVLTCGGHHDQPEERSTSLDHDRDLANFKWLGTRDAASGMTPDSRTFQMRLTTSASRRPPLPSSSYQ